MVRPDISSAVLKIFETEKFPKTEVWIPLLSPDTPSTREIGLRWLAPSLARLAALPLELNLCFTAVCKIIQTGSEAPHSLDTTKPVAHNPWLFNLLPSATPVGPCLAGSGPLSQAVRIVTNSDLLCVQPSDTI